MLHRLVDKTVSGLSWRTTQANHSFPHLFVHTEWALNKWGTSSFLREKCDENNEWIMFLIPNLKKNSSKSCLHLPYSDIARINSAFMYRFEMFGFFSVLASKGSHFLSSTGPLLPVPGCRHRPGKAEVVRKPRVLQKSSKQPSRLHLVRLWSLSTLHRGGGGN